MSSSPIKRIHFFYRSDHAAAKKWAMGLRSQLKKQNPGIKFNGPKPDLVVVLGGDGTILEAARKYQSAGSLIVGLNLGRMGFLAAVQESKHFLKGINKVLTGDYQIIKRMMLEAAVNRKSKTVFDAIALNDVVIKSPLAMVDLSVAIEGHTYQYVRGSGALIATATGSTAYNLSAHGPIVMPHIQCMIVSELLDHNLPTPSLVVEPNSTINVVVEDLRTQGPLKIKGKAADVVLSADGNQIFPLKIGDRIVIKRSAQHSNFAQVDPHAFLKGLQDKFAFK